jgi:hypothetical protein
MKEKICKFIRDVIYLVAKLVVVAVICVVISTFIFEQLKEEIWFEVVDSFQILYDEKVEELYDEFGVVSEGQDWKYGIQEIYSQPETDTKLIQL